MSNSWTADGYYNWTADGFGGWTADGFESLAPSSGLWNWDTSSVTFDNAGYKFDGTGGTGGTGGTWDFSDTFVTFDSTVYKFDGSGETTGSTYVLPCLPLQFASFVLNATLSSTAVNSYSLVCSPIVSASTVLNVSLAVATPPLSFGLANLTFNSGVYGAVLTEVTNQAFTISCNQIQLASMLSNVGLGTGALPIAYQILCTGVQYASVLNVIQLVEFPTFELHSLAIPFATTVGNLSFAIQTNYQIVCSVIGIISSVEPTTLNLSLPPALQLVCGGEIYTATLGTLGAYVYVPPPLSNSLPPGTPSLYGNRVTLPSKKLGESVIIPFDFTSKLAQGETISTCSCKVYVYTGTDTNPNAMLATASASFSGSVVNQLVTAGVVGTIYELLATVTTSLNQTLELSGYLAVVPDLP